MERYCREIEDAIFAVEVLHRIVQFAVTGDLARLAGQRELLLRLLKWRIKQLENST